MPFSAYLLNTYLIAAREKFHILKNGSDYQLDWPPLVYFIVTPDRILITNFSLIKKIDVYKYK